VFVVRKVRVGVSSKPSSRFTIDHTWLGSPLAYLILMEYLLGDTGLYAWIVGDLEQC
jgi:hypothetical protein